MDMSRIRRAEELEAEAKQLRLDAARPMPAFWKVGQKVRFIEDQEFGPSRGEVLEIVELRKPGTPATEYQVFWTSPLGKKSPIFWTTPNDVELFEDAA